jgi:hypothetical protein
MGILVFEGCPLEVIDIPPSLESMLGNYRTALRVTITDPSVDNPGVGEAETPEGANQTT